MEKEFQLIENKLEISTELTSVRIILQATQLLSNKSAINQLCDVTKSWSPWFSFTAIQFSSLWPSEDTCLLKTLCKMTTPPLECHANLLRRSGPCLCDLWPVLWKVLTFLHCRSSMRLWLWLLGPRAKWLKTTWMFSRISGRSRCAYWPRPWMTSPLLMTSCPCQVSATLVVCLIEMDVLTKRGWLTEGSC